MIQSIYDFFLCVCSFLDPSSILSFLLQNATISQQSQTDNGCYHTFLGQPVHLSVTVNQMKDEEETSQVAVSICSDLITAAAFHKAVTCRLQVNLVLVLFLNFSCKVEKRLVEKDRFVFCCIKLDAERF